MIANAKSAFRLLVATSVGVLSASALNAQQIHLVIAADTNEWPGDGERVSAMTWVEQLRDCFIHMVPRRHLPDPVVITGNAFTTGRVLREIDSLDPSPEDGIVFISMCHGAFDDNGHYFAMPDGRRLYRFTVVNKIKSRGAGVDVVLTESCNTYKPNWGWTMDLAAEPPRTMAPLFKSLFIDSQGLVDLNSASFGELSFVGFLFGALTDQLYEKADKSLTWYQFLPGVEGYIKSIYREGGGKVRYKGGGVQYDQNLKVWSVPVNPGERRYLGLEAGDVIMSINGKPIGNRRDCIEAVNGSDELMTFSVRDVRNGTVWRMHTTLDNRRGSRFGVSLEDNAGGGARITGLSRRSTAHRNRVLGRVPQ